MEKQVNKIAARLSWLKRIRQQRDPSQANLPLVTHGDLPSHRASCAHLVSVQVEARGQRSFHVLHLPPRMHTPPALLLTVDNSRRCNLMARDGCKGSARSLRKPIVPEESFWLIGQQACAKGVLLGKAAMSVLHAPLRFSLFDTALRWRGRRRSM